MYSPLVGSATSQSKHASLQTLGDWGTDTPDSLLQKRAPWCLPKALAPGQSI